MGNLVSGGGAAVGASGGGKVVMADGSVRALSEPVSVAELMMDHPRHFVVDARALKEQERHQRKQQQGGGGGAKVAPLPADHVLGAGGVYVLLPATTRGGKVSAEEARRALTAARTLARSRSMPGGLRRRLSSSSSSRKSRAPEADADGPASQGGAATAAAVEEDAAGPDADGFEEHRPEFLSRELSCRGWKPSLRTIEERAAPKKVPHWLF
ncbi:hypothetical protein ACP4OV_005146 [Aristida adscensionis]